MNFNSLQDTYTLNNGVKIPIIGFGTWQTPDGEVAEESVLAALNCGYRHIDTASAYGNEDSVGKAIQKALGAEGIVLMQLNGSKAGQTVPHIHFHLIPSSIHELGKHASQMGDQEKIKQLAEKIKAELA